MISYIETSRGVVAVRRLDNAEGKVAVTSVRGGRTHMVEDRFGHSRFSPFVHLRSGTVLKDDEEGLVWDRVITERASGGSGAIMATSKSVYLVAPRSACIMRYNPVLQTEAKFKEGLTLGKWMRTDCGRLGWCTQTPSTFTLSILDDDDVTWRDYAYPEYTSDDTIYVINHTGFRHKTAKLVQVLGDYALLREAGKISLLVHESAATSPYTTHAGDELKLTEHHYLERGEGDVVLLKCSNGNGELPIGLDYKERKEAAKRFAEREAEAEVDAKRVRRVGEEE